MDQKTRWNGTAGNAWIEMQEILDGMFKPFEELLVDAVVSRRSGRVLDVGCGTGGTTLAVARAVGANGACTGIDISAPMIEAARARAIAQGSAARFICADAQSHDLESASIDLIVSRFGVMFFDDPVAAFGNLRRAAKPKAKLTLIVWRSAADNPFMTTAEFAAVSILPGMPLREPNAPGQFAFADPVRVGAILQASGWADIDLQPVDVVCAMPESELKTYFTRFGVIAPLLREADDATRRRVIPTVRAAFEPYVHGGHVRFTSACWMVNASAVD